jgi:GcrA cell cycle regulator
MDKLKSGMCKWPVGDPKNDDFHFCGEPSGYDHAYCDQHMAAAHAQTRGHPANRSKKQNA